MSFLEIIVLAIIQGLTEFLPVSSSGHLVVANSVLHALGSQPVQDLIEVSIVLHLGTLMAVLVYYRRQLVLLLSRDRRVIPLLIVGTLPAVAFGLLLKRGFFEKMILESPFIAGLMFPITGIVLYWISRRKPGDTDYPEMTWRQSLQIGLMQAAAILPGISRSGFTIAGGLAVGLSRQAAATYAFLLAVPAILGAGILEGLEFFEGKPTGTPPLNLMAGFLVSFAVGWVALKLLVGLVQRGRLAMFTYYLVPLGVVVVVWQLLRS